MSTEPLLPKRKGGDADGEQTKRPRKGKYTPQQRREVNKDNYRVKQLGYALTSAQSEANTAASNWLYGSTTGKERQAALSGWWRQNDDLHRAVNYMPTKEGSAYEVLSAMDAVAALETRIKWGELLGKETVSYENTKMTLDEIRQKIVESKAEVEKKHQHYLTYDERKAAAKEALAKQTALKPSMAPTDDGSEQYKAWVEATAKVGPAKEAYDKAHRELTCKRARFLGRPSVEQGTEEDDEEDE